MWPGSAACCPTAGSGPPPQALDGWRWTVRATAETGDGRRGSASLVGTGHPGYTATAAMLVALGLSLADNETPVGGGVLTPALGFGPRPSPHLLTDELRLEMS